MRFRPATPADVDAIVPLVNAAYRGVGGVKGWTTEEHLVEGMRAEHGELLAMMREPDARFELALGDEGATEGSEEPDAPAGALRLLGSVFLRRELDGACYLGMLSVDPSRQAAGTGRALLARSEEIAREWGCARMRITVLDVRTELRAYYERRGYRATGRSAPFPESARSRLKIPGVQMMELEKPL